MTDLALVVRAPAALDHAAFTARVRERLLPALAGPIALALTERPPPRLAFVPPLARRPFALVVGARRAPDVEGLIVSPYRVSTSTPIEGPPTGPGMVTLFSPRAGLDRRAFVRRWHEGHSPLAMRTHPLVGYVRHVVEEPLDGAPPLGGIVLEQVSDVADLLRPWRFFGGARRMLPNMIRVGLDVRGWLDLKTIENQLVTVSRVG